LLDKEGTTIAFIMGIILFVIGIEYLVMMLIFLGLAVLATKHMYYMKKEIGIYEHERGWENVLFNGIIPVILAILSPQIGPVPFLCSISAIMSDKFASELGVLGGNPVNLRDLKPAKPGTSGAISQFGTIMSAGGSVMIGIVSIFLFNLDPLVGLYISIIGFIGSFIDSILGVFEEMKIGTKGTTNLLCSLSAGIIGHLAVIYRVF